MLACPSVSDERGSGSNEASDTAVAALFEEMKRYVRFSEADAAALRALGEHAEPHFPAITAEFYDRIREHEAAHEVLKDEAQIKRLERSLARWMKRVCTGPYDARYVAETAEIGRVHVRVGLPQRYMFTAMALIRVALGRIADEHLGDRATAAREALARVLDLELAIMLETYRDALIAKVQRVDRLERAEVGRTLARTEHRYRNAVELARVLVVGLDDQAIVRLWNREAERVTGLGRDEVLGSGFAEALLPEPLAAEHGELLRDLAGGALPEGFGRALESAVRTRTGKAREVRWQLAYAPKTSDDDVVLFAVGEDVTEVNALAARVRRTEKLAAVGTLAAGLAHEIRNPLNGAQLHVTVLERGLKRAQSPDADAVEAVGVVRDELRRLDLLVREFLDFARPAPLVKAPVSLRGLCERAAGLLGASEPAVTLDLPAGEVLVEADGGKLQQVLLNLLQNAVEAVGARPAGSVILRVRRRPREAVVEVEDDGSGLPPGGAPIFDAFFSTKPRGTGLGLAIAHRIVTDHGGAIDVESRPGRTLFRVSLPLPLSSLPSSSPPSAP